MRTQLRSLVAICLIFNLCSGIFAAEPKADTVPLCGPICFHSSDPSLVSVTLIHELQPDRTTHLSIPRSAIIFVSEYRPSDYEGVPDEVVSRGAWFDFAIVMPGGMPFGGAVERFAKDKSVSLNSAATALRDQNARVRVRLIGKGVDTDRLYSAWLPRATKDQAIKDDIAVDGLPAKTTEFHALRSDGSRDPALSLGHHIVYFPKDKSDPFTLIQCERSAPPRYWCHYVLRLNDLVSLEVDMVDFRFHGGRQFVRDRMNSIVKAYCSYDPSCCR